MDIVLRAIALMKLKLGYPVKLSNTHEMLLITDSFFIKSNLQEPLKNVRDLGLENIFSVTIKRLLISSFFFFFFNSDI